MKPLSLQILNILPYEDRITILKNAYDYALYLPDKADLKAASKFTGTPMVAVPALFDHLMEDALTEIRKQCDTAAGGKAAERKLLQSVLQYGYTYADWILTGEGNQTGEKNAARLAQLEKISGMLGKPLGDQLAAALEEKLDPFLYTGISTSLRYYGVVTQPSDYGIQAGTEVYGYELPIKPGHAREAGKTASYKAVDAEAARLLHGDPDNDKLADRAPVLRVLRAFAKKYPDRAQQMEYVLDVFAQNYVKRAFKEKIEPQGVLGEAKQEIRKLAGHAMGGRIIDYTEVTIDRLLKARSIEPPPHTAR